MKVQQLAAIPKEPSIWTVTFHNHRKIEVKAESVFESDSRVYFSSAPQPELFPLVASGKAINTIVAAFDTEAVLYYSKNGKTKARTATTKQRKKS